MIREINISTTNQTEFIDITRKVEDLIEASHTKNGVIILFVPHTTAAVTINENADPSVKLDMIKELNKIVPFQDGYEHMEGNSAAHIKSSIMGFSETVIMQNGRLVLGTWQGIYFCEFDGPRNRKIILNIIE